ncbi:thermonuclease family protein, partial [bacterium]|nr:thermonuclease family protein [bacterium]MBU1917284.1 thermonuclease family protein [bacterium]
MCKKNSITILFFVIFLFCPLLLRAENNIFKNYKYFSSKVLDGDTFIATDGNIKFSVRIVGMDAPESGQAYGKLATNKLKSLIENQSIQIKPVGNGRDRYGRTLGQVFVNGEDIALNMIKEGLAYYYRPRCKDYPEDKDKYNYNPLAYVEAENKA